MQRSKRVFLLVFYWILVILLQFSQGSAFQLLILASRHPLNSILDSKQSSLIGLPGTQLVCGFIISSDLINESAFLLSLRSSLDKNRECRR